VLLALLVAASTTHLPFVADDYPAALAQARREHKPLFVDFWATWCHTCLSMKRTVMEDPGLRPVADAVVWASIETEAEKNKPVVDRFPLDVWPTFLIINPDDESVLGRWLGAASVNDFRSFVQGGVAAYRERKGTPKSPAAAAQRLGDEARLKGKLEESAAAYAKALELTRADDPARPERLALYINALRKLRKPESARSCVRLALAELGNTGDTAITTDFLSYAAACASDLPKDNVEVMQLRAASISRLSVLLAKPDAPLSVDDRSDAYANLIELLDASKMHGDAIKFARKRAAMLEEAAAKAPDATAASTWDPHRTDTYLYLGEPQKAEAMLAQREKQMPGDYNAPARLARVLLEEGKLREAEAAVDRALAEMSRGNRCVGILGLKARILAAEGKPVDNVLREQLEVMRGLPQTQRNPQAEAKLAAQLGEGKKQ
jgi:tetratricopeptide (TPR) repeat protein